jgi:hypothetical protein
MDFSSFDRTPSKLTVFQSAKIHFVFKSGKRSTTLEQGLGSRISGNPVYHDFQATFSKIQLQKSNCFRLKNWNSLDHPSGMAESPLSTVADMDPTLCGDGCGAFLNWRELDAPDLQLVRKARSFNSPRIWNMIIDREFKPQHCRNDMLFSSYMNNSSSSIWRILYGVRRDMRFRCWHVVADAIRAAFYYDVHWSAAVGILPYVMCSRCCSTLFHNVAALDLRGIMIWMIHGSAYSEGLGVLTSKDNLKVKEGLSIPIAVLLVQAAGLERKLDDINKVKFFSKHHKLGPKFLVPALLANRQITSTYHEESHFSKRTIFMTGWRDGSIYVDIGSFCLLDLRQRRVITTTIKRHNIREWLEWIFCSESDIYRIKYYAEARYYYRRDRITGRRELSGPWSVCRVEVALSNHSFGGCRTGWRVIASLRRFGAGEAFRHLSHARVNKEEGYRAQVKLNIMADRGWKTDTSFNVTAPNTSASGIALQWNLFIEQSLKNCASLPPELYWEIFLNLVDDDRVENMRRESRRLFSNEKLRFWGFYYCMIVGYLDGGELHRFSLGVVLDRES